VGHLFRAALADRPSWLPATQVMLRPAAEGTGVIAGGAVRVVLELAGVKNGFGKQLGSGNPLNNARACIKGLDNMRTFQEVRGRRRGGGMHACACQYAGAHKSCDCYCWLPFGSTHRPACRLPLGKMAFQPAGVACVGLGAGVLHC
jgi:hypothetical protein